MNINLNAMTIEQLSTVRKNCALDFARTLLQESREYLSGLMSWDGTLGLKWVKLGASRPQFGSEIKNDALAQALVHSNEFTLAEFESFGVKDLSHQSFVQVDVSSEAIFFKPADSIQAIERRMLEPWEKKSVEWFNKDVSNFKEAIDQIFDNWTTALAANVEDLQVEARQKQIEADQEGSARKMETALKLLNRAIFIAERASGIQIGNAQQFLFELTEEQSRRERSTGGGAARPGLQLSTSIFAEASRLMTSSSSSVPSAEEMVIRTFYTVGMVRISGLWRYRLSIVWILTRLIALCRIFDGKYESDDGLIQTKSSQKDQCAICAPMRRQTDPNYLYNTYNTH